MKLSVACLSSTRHSASPYRVLDEHGREVVWANAFLDAKHLLQRSPRSLRAYAFDLLHFARWAQPAADAQPPRQLVELNESILRDYLRFQIEQQPCPAPQTINHRLDLLRALYRFHFDCEVPGEARPVLPTVHGRRARHPPRQTGLPLGACRALPDSAPS